MNVHERYMRIAIDLAKNAEGQTSPNPIVGAVIVKAGHIVGSGYHKRAGSSHAEVNALRKAGRRARGATLYVSLEPCDHFGRTPPCTDAIIRSGIRRVVIGMTDPNPMNDGRGTRRLNEHGVETRVGILEEEALSINRPYIKFVTKKMPYVTVKVAQSLDGKIATKTGDSRWISSADSRRYVHELRSKVDAIMVGAKTVIKDDPLLMSVLSKERQPIRIIADNRLETPIDARVFSKIHRSPVIIVTVKGSPKIKRYERRGAEVLVVKSSATKSSADARRGFDGGQKAKVDLKKLLKILAKRDITHLLVEGGGELVASFIENNLADRIFFFIAPKIIGGRDAITSVEGRGVAKVEDAVAVKDLKIRRFKKDILVEAEMQPL